MTDIVTDFFERAASTSLGNAETGQAWTERVGDWALDGSGNVHIPSGTALGIATVDAGNADCDVECEMESLASGGNGGIVFRWSDANNYWRLFIRGIADEVTLQKVSGGVATNMGGSPWGPIPKHTQGFVRAILNGNQIRVYHDRWLLGTVTDSHNATATHHGLWSNGSADWKFEAFWVRELQTETTLKFEVGPDDIATGGAGHRTIVRVNLDGFLMADVPSLVESGNDGVREWREATLDITHNIPSGVYEITFAYQTHPTIAAQDATHIRRVRLTSPSIDYGRDYLNQPYEAADQDGYPAGNNEMGIDGTASTGQLNAVTKAKDDPGDGLLHWFFGGGGIYVDMIAIGSSGIGVG